MPVPDDIYKRGVDFTALALQYAAFAKQLKPNRQLDFSDPESVRQLTKALLHRDFNLTIDLPHDRLCPPVPNRFNYILFAQRLLDTTRFDYNEGYPASDRCIGLDIGTGASAIYPLLACRQRPTWAFLATEIDAKSRSYAEKNINTNQLQSKIKLLTTDTSGQRILPSSELERFDNYAVRIQVTNPPFYSSEAEMLQSAKMKSRPPNSACTGAPVEMIVDGGEVAFVSQIINESALPENRSKIQWFSSMLGKFGSVSVIIKRLQEIGCSNYATTEFIQGETVRWCVAWSWLHLRPPTSLARGIAALEKKDLPFPSDHEIEVADVTPMDTHRSIDEAISKLDLQWRANKDSGGGTGRSMTGDVWSRKARRRKQRDHDMKDADDKDSDSSDDEQEPALAFRINITPSTAGGKALNKVHVRWLQGKEHVLFESFCGWLKRTLNT